MVEPWLRPEPMNVIRTETRPEGMVYFIDLRKPQTSKELAMDVLVRSVPIAW